MAAEISSYVVANEPIDESIFEEFWYDVLSQGIMGLGRGYYHFNDYAMLVLPEIHTDYGHHKDVLLDIMNNRADRQWENKGKLVVKYDYELGKVVETGMDKAPNLSGEYDILALMFYNPSSPSLYLVYASDGDEGFMGPIPVHQKGGDEIMAMANEMLRDSGEPVDLEGKENLWSGFNDTSIRPIWLLRKSKRKVFAAINNKVVVLNR